jgi:solute carrier family 36 (proton-coupled amino acid transporter)
MMHYRVVSAKLWERALNLFLVVFGIVMMVYTTTLTVERWIDGGRAKSPGYCDHQ